MTVPQEVKLARHAADIDDDGHHTGGGSGFLTKIEGGQDTIKAHGSTGSTETIDPTDGNVHTLTLNADCTITLNAPVGSGASTLEVYALQDGTGGWDLTWPGTVVWPGGTDPVPDTDPDTLTRYVLETLDGGTTWYGVMVGGAGGSALTVKDEGSSLDTAVTSIDAVGAGITATNTGHAVTLTVPGQTFATPAVGYGMPAGGAASTGIRSDATIAKPTAADVDFSSDVTTSNATTGHHGLLPKLDGNAAHVLAGDGSWVTPSTTGTSSTDAAIWRPVLDGATGDVLQDGGTGEAIMAYGPA